MKIFDLLKIFFCTRTHSQISQFIGEIQKTKYIDQLRLVALGSRQVRKNKKYFF